MNLDRVLWPRDALQHYSGGPAETGDMFTEVESKEAEAEKPSAELDLQLYEGKWQPLNSKRLTNGHRRLIAETWGLPMSLSKDELRQQIEGKLLELEREPGLVQVVVRETAKIEVCLSLVDEHGAFQTCGPTMLESTDEDRRELE